MYQGDMPHKEKVRVEARQAGPSKAYLYLCAFILFSLGWLLTLYGPTAHAQSATSIKSRIKIKKRSQLSQTGGTDFEQYSVEKINLLAKKRRNLILDIKRFIREARHGDQKSELNLRLAALYMEDYYQNLAKANRIFEKKIEAYDKLSKKKKKRRRQPKLDNSEAMASLKKARSIYKDLLKNYPKHHRGDEALYFLAATSIDVGKIDQSMKFFTRLSQQYPKSRFIFDALLQLGDYYFDKNQFKKAESYYDKVINKKAKSLIAYAKYKKAWCAYNTGRVKETLNLLKWVVAREGATDASSLQVRREAIRDISLAFVDLKLLKPSVVFFHKLGDEFERSGLQNMAAMYLEKGDHKRSRTLYETLLKIDPNHKKNPEYDLSIIESYKLQNNGTAATNRLFSRLPLYLKNSNWYELHASDPSTRKKAANLFEETARKFAFQYHAEAQKTKSKKGYEVAKRLYAKYLKFFPLTPKAPQIRFYMAEILYKQKKNVPAAMEYYRVYKNPQAATLRLDAIRYALSALDREMNAERKRAGLDIISATSSKKLKSDKLEMQPYSKVESSFLKISDEYLKKYPRTKDAPEILFTQAYLQYAHVDLGKAYIRFWIFLKKQPKHAAAYTAANLILDILNRQKKYAKLVAACKKFLSMQTFKRVAFRNNVGDILRKSELKRIALLERAKKYKQAALGYIEYTKAYGAKDVSLYEKALYNASVNFTKARMHSKAVETQEKFLRRFKKSPLREKLLLSVAKTYEMLANFGKAADFFDTFAKTYPRNKQAKNALRLAGLYYWGSGKSNQAAATMKQFLAKYPNGADHDQVERDLIDLYASEGDTRSQIAIYDKKRNRKGVSFADQTEYSIKIAELQGVGRGSRTAKSALAQALKHQKYVKKSREGREALSKLHLWSMTKKEQNFYGIQLRLPQKKLEQNFQKKLAMLKNLESEYKRVTSYGSGEWGLGAIFKTAKAYRHVAQVVLQAPIPNELSAQQVEVYRNELQKSFIQPFNEKALTFSVQCLDRAQELNLLSPWTSACYTLASELQPKRYPRVRTFYLPPLRTALLNPTKKSRLRPGNVKRFAFPLYSSGLFKSGALERTLAGVTPFGSPLFGNQEDEGFTAQPVGLTYRLMADYRKKTLLKEVRQNRPGKNEAPTFAYLNYARLIDPKSAVPLILNVLEKDPKNVAVHNLLGLTYMEMGNLSAAKVTFLALLARGFKASAIWNNLAVIASLEGRERQALDMFYESTRLPKAKEAQVNLGFIALKYYNGFEAKKQFKKAIDLGSKDPTVEIAYTVARLQNRELENVRQLLPDLTKRYKNNPYARLSMAYLLIDVEQESELAKTLLSEYMSRQAAENDPQFRQALSEAKEGAGNTLPTIGN